MYKVLAVDDMNIFLLELKRLKVWGQKSGFEIIDTASNGKEALGLLNQNKYDLVLTDIRMPIIDGLQLLKEIQEDKLCPCVVFVSEYSEFSYAREGIVLGAFDYIVKSANEETMTELLSRAKRHLEEYYITERENQNALSEVDSELVYPSSDEKQIVKYLINRDNKAIDLFNLTIENINNILLDNLSMANIIIKKLYHNIINETYLKLNWISSFMNIDFFENSEDNQVIHYSDKLTLLLDFIKNFYIDTSDELIKNVSEYILNNYNSDIKLKAIAEKFYINNTYLSNTFANKTGVKFNDYVTMVKMARARYLLTNTQLKTYEVGYEIGYHDINYFSKLFKKYYGKNPSEYRKVV